MPEAWAEAETWISLATLTALEVVLGIDNMVFISILSGRLPEGRQALARRLGLSLALVTRLLLLTALAWLARLTAPLFAAAGRAFSGRDLVLIAGGLFLLYKSTREIHARVEGEDEGGAGKGPPPSLASVLVQIMFLDIIFSLDSIITAVGMVDRLWVMAAAVVVAVAIMLALSGPIAGFVNRHPSVKMLALAFLILVGATLVADGCGFHIPKGYVYSSMAFALAVEALNLLAARGRRRGGNG